MTDHKLTKAEAGRLGARTRWGLEPRTVRLDRLDPDTRRSILALLAQPSAATNEAQRLSWYGLPPQVATSLEEVAWRVLAALEHKRDAINGQTHPGESHDTVLHFDPCSNLPDVEHVYDLVGDCARCGGAQYGAGDLENAAWGDLRAALGLERYQWQPEYPAEAFAPFREAVR